MKHSILAVCTAIVLLVSFFAYDGSTTGKVFEDVKIRWQFDDPNAGGGRYTTPVTTQRASSYDHNPFSYFYSSRSPGWDYRTDRYELADVSGDGVVDMDDQAIMNTVRFGISKGQSSLNKEEFIFYRNHRNYYGMNYPFENFDLNNDGLIDYLDYRGFDGAYHAIVRHAKQ